MPNVEFKRKSRLSRREVAERLIALGNALAAGSEVELSSGGDTLKIGVAGQLDFELEIEIDGDRTELEIEIKWTDDPAANPAPDPAPPAADATPQTSDPDPDSPAASDRPAPARRGRPRRTAAT